MGRSACYSKVFVVGRKHKRVINRSLTSEPLPNPADVKEPVSTKRGKKREAKLQRYLLSSRVLPSEEAVEDLLDLTSRPGLVFALPDALDEAELRAHFPNKGIGHNFFMGRHFFRFLLANDCTSVVAQVLRQSI